MTDEITKNDCQGEDDYATFYRALPPFEKKLFKAIGIAFQLKDFGHNVIDEIDDECFEQDAEQMARFTEANKAALAAVMGIVSPEIARLNEQLTEAREIIKGLMPAALSGILNEISSNDDDPMTMDNDARRAFSDPRLRRARAFLKGETDNDAN